MIGNSTDIAQILDFTVNAVSEPGARVGWAISFQFDTFFAARLGISRE